MLASDFGVGQFLWDVFWFTMFFIWIWLLIMVFSDIWRSHDLNGWAKALWVIGIIIFPYLGVFVYLIARGGKMHQHTVAALAATDAANRAYIRDAAGTPSNPADELARLADLHSRGVIDDAEFAQLKAKVTS
jgi:putative oligomerization/nucleic acid binding protein/phospholipase D-like protein